MTNRWAEALTKFTDRLLSIPPDDDEADILYSFTEYARTAAGARWGALYLPGLGGTWVCESAIGELEDGRDAQDLLGEAFVPPAGTLEVLADGHAILRSGQAFLPIYTQHALHGCLQLAGVSNWDDTRGRVAAAYAKQGAIALELLESRQSHDLALLLEERERISRDLHDLGIQHLFATGMMLESLKRRVREGASARQTEHGLDQAMERLDEAVRQIRNIVYRLRDDDEAMGLIEAIEREASVARAHLGFAPTITVAVEGRVVRPGSEQMRELRADAPNRISPRLTEDVIAVVRESLTNIARHAHAHSAQVRLNIFGSGPTGEVELVVVDDGAGVDPSHARSSGMANMQRRATARGGSFAVSAGPLVRGTSLVWRAPLE